MLNTVYSLFLNFDFILNVKITANVQVIPEKHYVLYCREFLYKYLYLKISSVLSLNNNSIFILLKTIGLGIDSYIIIDN